jgi:hypothetical protein
MQMDFWYRLAVREFTTDAAERASDLLADAEENAEESAAETAEVEPPAPVDFF